MDPSHRIQQLTATPTLDRQTPRSGFGEVLAQTLSTGTRVTAAFLGAAGGPALSAAVAGVTRVASASPMHEAMVPWVGGAVSAGGAVPQGAGTPPAGVGGPGAGMDLLEAQRALQAEGQQFNAAYLQLQDQMQRESRQFDAVSNIMKVRHDSAKAAINNIH
jgi:hypothetical protein